MVAIFAMMQATPSGLAIAARDGSRAMYDRSAEQFAQSCAKSASHLASASLNAYADMAASSIRLWSGAAEAWMNAAASASSTGRPAASTVPAFPFWPMPSAAFAMQLPMQLGPAWTAFTSPVSPMTAWNALLSGVRLFGAFPLAGALMSSGVPSRTAWPAAKAGAAALDAADIATRAVERAFSSYRSDGGHAVAQIVVAPAVASTVAAFTAPAMLYAMQPWLMGSGRR